MSWLLVSCWRLMPAMQLVRRTRCQPHWHYLQSHHAIVKFLFSSAMLTDDMRLIFYYHDCWQCFVFMFTLTIQPLKWYSWGWLPNPCPPWPYRVHDLFSCHAADVDNGCDGPCGHYPLVTLATVLVSMLMTSTELWLITYVFAPSTWLMAIAFDDWWCASWIFVCWWLISTEVGVWCGVLVVLLIDDDVGFTMIRRLPNATCVFRWHCHWCWGVGVEDSRVPFFYALNARAHCPFWQCFSCLHCTHALFRAHTQTVALRTYLVRLRICMLNACVYTLSM